LREWPGKAHPLGATWDEKGTNFSIFSENATAVKLLLYDGAEEKEPSESITLKKRTGNIWHAYLPDLMPGQLYAYSVSGPFEPQSGHRFNPYKALIDPYAKAITNTPAWDDSLLGYKAGDPNEDLSMDRRASDGSMPKCVVIDPSFDWEDDKPLRIPWSETVIYELHVRGFTKLHKDVDKQARGTYAGLASPKVVGYIKDLGITAVELLPVHHCAIDKFVAEKGLTNYWRYHTIGFFAPESMYSSSGAVGQQVREFKEMVKAFHRSGLEVILDVVYNHTGEGNHLGPTLSFRGIDNAAYYRTSPHNPRLYVDFTGTGNSLNVCHPQVIQLIMDSLRYWVLEMHVDGFRFDLAPTLARGLYEVDSRSTFFQVIQQDPVISQVKLIAEPWDVGEGGYQLGRFPNPWAEWNGKYRDAARRFWRGDESQVAEIGHRLGGSSDLYQASGRNPQASINFVTCHDGFTLRDLSSYDEKHNEANEEGNSDGTNENYSWNCGAEGTSDEPQVNELRRRQSKNLLLTLLASQGVPMLLAGDEFGRTQRGNNNAYCQDNEISWVDWDLDEEAMDLLAFTRKAIHLRKEHPVFRRKRFSSERGPLKSPKDLTWFQPDGSEMTDLAWESPTTRNVALMLAGDSMEEPDEHGETISDETFLLLLNGSPEAVSFAVPNLGAFWETSISSLQFRGASRKAESGGNFTLEGRSAVVLRMVA
jgi:isoamylase